MFECSVCEILRALLSYVENENERASPWLICLPLGTKGAHPLNVLCVLMSKRVSDLALTHIPPTTLLSLLDCVAVVPRVFLLCNYVPLALAAKQRVDGRESDADVILERLDNIVRHQQQLHQKQQKQKQDEQQQQKQQQKLKQLLQQQLQQLLQQKKKSAAKSNEHGGKHLLPLSSGGTSRRGSTTSDTNINQCSAVVGDKFTGGDDGGLDLSDLTTTRTTTAAGNDHDSDQNRTLDESTLQQQHQELDLERKIQRQLQRYLHIPNQEQQQHHRRRHSHSHHHKLLSVHQQPELEDPVGDNNDHDINGIGGGRDRDGGDWGEIGREDCDDSSRSRSLRQPQQQQCRQRLGQETRENGREDDVGSGDERRDEAVREPKREREHEESDGERDQEGENGHEEDDCEEDCQQCQHEDCEEDCQQCQDEDCEDDGHDSRETGRDEDDSFHQDNECGDMRQLSDSFRSTRCESEMDMMMVGGSGSTTTSTPIEVGSPRSARDSPIGVRYGKSGNTHKIETKQNKTRKLGRSCSVICIVWCGSS